MTFVAGRYAIEVDDYECVPAFADGERLIEVDLYVGEEEQEEE